MGGGNFRLKISDFRLWRDGGFFCAKREVEVKMFGHVKNIVFLTNRKDYEALLSSAGKAKVSWGEAEVSKRSHIKNQKVKSKIT